MTLDHLWPDPDRRDDALLRCLEDVYRADEELVPPVLLVDPDDLTPEELRILGALSHGLGDRGAAHALGVTWDSVRHSSRSARRKLRAKNTTHACCEALRQGLIK